MQEGEAPIDLVLIGLGPHARAKYAPLIRDGLASGTLASFSVIELEDKEVATREWIAANNLEVRLLCFLPQVGAGAWYRQESEQALDTVRQDLRNPKAVVSTEPKAHYGYVAGCLKRDISCLVDKPISLPMGANGLLAADRISSEFNQLVKLSKSSRATCHVMAPRRYHRAYNIVQRLAEGYVRKYRSPITHAYMFHAGGVWVLPHEFEDQPDHPHRYGYGMLMHSGYHYVDVLQQLLSINNLLVPPAATDLQVATFAGFPLDHFDSQGRYFYPALNARADRADVHAELGETDIVASIRQAASNGRTMALANLAMLQTSTSLRGWESNPAAYNRLGRYSFEELRVDIGFHASISLRNFRTPRDITKKPVPLDHHSEITVWRNGKLTGQPAFRQKILKLSPQTKYDSHLHGSRVRLFERWLEGREFRSELSRHAATVSLMEQLARGVAASRVAPEVAAE